MLLFSLCLVSFVYSNSLFEGEWYIQVSGQEDEGETLLNLTSTGSVMTSKFSCGGEHFKLLFEFASEYTGEVRLVTSTETESSSNNENEELFVSEESGSQTLFQFDFVNKTNSFLLSQGNFQGSTLSNSGHYQLVLTSPTTFFFTLYNKEGSNALTVTGRKQLRQAEGSFWTRMPSPMMMFGILLLSQWFKPRVPGPEAARRTSVNQRTTQANPRVQDVTNEDTVD